MHRPRAAVVALVGCGLSFSILAGPSCSTEGEVLVALPRADATTGEVALGDADRPDSAPSGEDVAELHCQVESGSCRYPGEQCCIYLLSMFCTTRGECDSGGIECSRSGHCAPGLRCCAQGAAFSITSSCRAECPVYQLCAADGECADGGRCMDGGAAGFATCQ